jgi:hypothetical protein
MPPPHLEIRQGDRPRGIDNASALSRGTLPPTMIARTARDPRPRLYSQGNHRADARAPTSLAGSVVAAGALNESLS